MPRKDKISLNLLFAISGLFAVLLLLNGLFSIYLKDNFSNKKEKNMNFEVTQKGWPQVTARRKIPINTAGWKTYQNNFYNFEIKYPGEWAAPKEEKISDRDFAYEYKIIFSPDGTQQSGSATGFTIYIYKTGPCMDGSNFSNGQNLNSSNQPSNNITPQCSTHKAVVVNGNNDYFYEFSGKIYTFTIFPFPADENNPILAESSRDQFEAVVKTIVFDSIPKPENKTIYLVPKKPVVKGTIAVIYSGKQKCPHPGQRPQKSPTKGKHVDEDCCSDPDEWPNPICAYKSSDYGIMLKGPRK
jgi:hypothetical protein